MLQITALTAHEIQDSRGNPTLEVTLGTQGAAVSASVPSGASVGVHEALELRDADGKGVTRAMRNIEERIAPALIGKRFDQHALDTSLRQLDGTPNKRELGANAILGVSIAFARASALEERKALYAYLGSLAGRTTYTLPQPLFNILNGGKHAKHGIDIQECMLAPIAFPTLHEKVAVAQACVEQLRVLLEAQGLGTLMGDEGGFAPALGSNEAALDLLVEATRAAGYTGDEIGIALDVAASSLYESGEYVFKAGGTSRNMSPDALLEWYEALAGTYPLISIEDGFSEDDWEGFTRLTGALGSRLAIVGDDLIVTNPLRMQEAIEKRAVNACIIKPNQIGTVSEAIDAVETARKAGWKIFASHRSGETMDTFIADFAVGLSCDHIKAGAPTRPERLIKYTRLMEIETELGL